MNPRCHLMREHSPDECGWPSVDPPSPAIRPASYGQSKSMDKRLKAQGKDDQSRTGHPSVMSSPDQAATISREDREKGFQLALRAGFVEGRHGIANAKWFEAIKSARQWLQIAHQAKEDQQPVDAPRFIDTPVLKAKRAAFDYPSQANLDALIEAVQQSSASRLQEVEKARDRARQALDELHSDAMVAHRWFAEQYGEVMNGRSFADKVAMANLRLQEVEAERERVRQGWIGLASWMRAIGTIDRKDAIDACAREVENYAEYQFKLSAAPDSPPQEQP